MDCYRHVHRHSWISQHLLLVTGWACGYRRHNQEPYFQDSSHWVDSMILHIMRIMKESVISSTMHSRFMSEPYSRNARTSCKYPTDFMTSNETSDSFRSHCTSLTWHDMAEGHSATLNSFIRMDSVISTTIPITIATITTTFPERFNRGAGLSRLKLDDQ